jgi:hypothetical protein
VLKQGREKGEIEEQQQANGKRRRRRRGGKEEQTGRGGGVGPLGRIKEERERKWYMSPASRNRAAVRRFPHPRRIAAVLSGRPVDASNPATTATVHKGERGSAASPVQGRPRVGRAVREPAAAAGMGIEANPRAPEKALRTKREWLGL